VTTTLSDPELREPRTYGNWRRPSSPGLFGLGQAGTIALFAAICLAVLAAVFSGLPAAVVVSVFGAAMLVPIAWRDRHHRTLWQRALTRVGWRWSQAAGANVYRSGPLTTVGKCALPGLAAAAELIEATDSHGQPYALISHPRVAHLTAVIGVEPEGVRNVDPETVDAWVAHWGAWLAVLGEDADIVGASVTVEAAPGTGLRLRREVEGQMVTVAPRSAGDPYSAPPGTWFTAPPLAQKVLNEVVDSYPAGSAEISARVAITWARGHQEGRRKARSVAEMAVEVGHRLPGLVSMLRMTGAGDARALTAPEIAGVVRAAFDPDAAAEIESVGLFEANIAWDNAGPVAADEAWDHYRHDGATSMSWEMTTAPRSAVHATSLLRLLDPHPAIKRKRVTMLYRPYSASAAAEVVDADVAAARFNAGGNRRGVTARGTVDMEAARLAAQEEAQGAGLTRFGMVVTVTTGVGDELGPIATAVQHIASASRIVLRPTYGQQANYFAASLPLGVILAAHVRTPTEIREVMQ
jgi:hypothetical protein